MVSQPSFSSKGKGHGNEVDGVKLEILHFRKELTNKQTNILFIGSPVVYIMALNKNKNHTDPTNYYTSN